MQQPEQTKTESQALADLYENDIIPLINKAQSGDELLYVSPSTFFGFYSVGARNFVNVCQSLNEAKRRGVKIRLIIDVHDVLTARAAEGLLTFLKNGRELKHLEDNTDTYTILLYRKSGTSAYFNIISDQPKIFSYLPNIQVRPFKEISQHEEAMSNEHADSKRREFYRLWDKEAIPVRPHINQYLPRYLMHHRIILLQFASYLLVLGLGLALGVSFLIQGIPSQLNPITIVSLLVASLGTGLLGTWLATLFTRKFIG